MTVPPYYILLFIMWLWFRTCSWDEEVDDVFEEVPGKTAPDATLISAVELFVLKLTCLDDFCPSSEETLQE